MRLLSLIALIVGVILIPTTLGVAKLDHDRDASELERALLAETDEHGGALESYFARSRSIVLLTANSPAFANVLAEPGTRAQKVRRQSRNLARGHASPPLPRAAVPDEHRRGLLHRRARGGVRARRPWRASRSRATSRRREEETAFFAPTFALGFGQVHQTAPYVSPDTKEWVVANATLIPQRDGHKRAFVHFEVTVESFRRAMGHEVRRQRPRAARRRRAHRPGRDRFGARRSASAPRSACRATRGSPQLARTAGQQGVSDVGGRRVAYRRVGRRRGQRQRLARRRERRAADRRASSAGLGPVPIAVLVPRAR